MIVTLEKEHELKKESAMKNYTISCTKKWFIEVSEAITRVIQYITPVRS
jgi:hypothetical protein